MGSVARPTEQENWIIKRFTAFKSLATTIPGALVLCCCVALYISETWRGEIPEASNAILKDVPITVHYVGPEFDTSEMVIRWPVIDDMGTDLKRAGGIWKAGRDSGWSLSSDVRLNGEFMEVTIPRPPSGRVWFRLYMQDKDSKSYNGARWRVLNVP